MGRVTQTGFTIVEVMLFLAVSAALFAALMVGVNGSIAQERYKDSVTSFESTIQNQYTQVANVQNDRATSWSCGSFIKQDASVSTIPGSTDCLLIGRMIQLSEGSNLKIDSIVAYNVDTEGLASAQGDVAALTGSMTLTALSQASASASGAELTNLDWGSTARVIDKNGNSIGTGGNFTVAIVRSPLSGRTLTFVVNEATENWKDKIISADSLTRPLIACIEPAVGVTMPHSAVEIQPNASTTSGVAVTTGATGC